MDRDRKEELWRLGGKVVGLIEAIDGPYGRTVEALRLAEEFRRAAVDDEPLWGCEGCDGYVWDDDGHAATSEDGLHFCGDCIRRMDAEDAA